MGCRLRKLPRRENLRLPRPGTTFRGTKEGVYVAEDVGPQGESHRIESSIGELFLEVVHSSPDIL